MATAPPASPSQLITEPGTTSILVPPQPHHPLTLLLRGRGCRPTGPPGLAIVSCPRGFQTRQQSLANNMLADLKNSSQLEIPLVRGVIQPDPNPTTVSRTPSAPITTRGLGSSSSH